MTYSANYDIISNVSACVGFQSLFLSTRFQRVWLEEVKNMFAIVQTGGKQYKVSEGDVISVEKLENAVGDKVKLEVLLVSDNGNVVAGSPTVKGAICEAEVLAHGKGDKIVVFKYKPKKNERKKQGHRQPFTQLKVLSIKK